MKNAKLKLNIANMTGGEIDEKFFQKVGERTLELVDYNKELEVELVFVGEKEMQNLNRRWRGKNKVTDVLSFSDLDAREKGGDVAELMGGFAEVVICLPYAKKKARRDNLIQDQELAMLFAHGILHILGHDHERSEEEEKVMWGVQNKIIEEFK